MHCSIRCSKRLKRSSSLFNAVRCSKSFTPISSSLSRTPCAACRPWSSPSPLRRALLEARLVLLLGCSRSQRVELLGCGRPLRPASSHASFARCSRFSIASISLRRRVLFGFQVGQRFLQGLHVHELLPRVLLSGNGRLINASLYLSLVMFSAMLFSRHPPACASSVQHRLSPPAVSGSPG
jgi:hypothetical protein